MEQWQLAELAGKVGGLLGFPLDLTWDGQGVRLGVEGDGLYLHEQYSQPGRIQISGWFPRSSMYFPKGLTRHIGVAAARGPKAIAAEIDRRLLPAYRAAIARVREHDAREQAEQEARDQLSAFITGLFPPKATSMPGHMQHRSGSEVIVYMPGHQGGTVKVSAGAHEVTFDRFRVPAAVALRMLETVALLTGYDTSWENE
jgi:hypothetical protein